VIVTVLTVEATDFGQDSAMLWGTVLDDFSSPCQCRFKYWKSRDVGISRTSWTGELRVGDRFCSLVTGLEPGTKYWFWAELATPTMESDGWSSGVETFTTLAGLIQVYAPNGGECFACGSMQTIDWMADASVSDVILEYSLDNGGAWNPIAVLANTAQNHSCQ